MRNEVFFITNGVSPSGGGLTNAVVNRSFGLSKRKIKTSIVSFLDEFKVEAGREYFQGQGRIDSSVKWVNLYYYFRDISSAKNKPTPISKVKSSIRYRFLGIPFFDYRHNGSLYLRRSFDGGRLSSIEYLDSDLKLVRREQYDKLGYLQRSTYYIDSKPSYIYRYTQSGFCYLKTSFVKSDKYKHRLYGVAGSRFKDFKNIT